jgi:mono/diheme cytochrome c family protein
MRSFMASVAGVLVSTSLVAAADVDYTKDVKPILAKNCYSCHGAGKAKGKLAVDSLAAMLKGGSSGPSVVPGKAKESPLIHSLTGDGDIKRMPPKRGLSKDEIDTLTKWVDAGAKAPDEKADVAANPAVKKPGERDRRRRGREGMRREMERKREAEKKQNENKKDDDKKDDKKKDGDKKGDRKKDRDDD